MNKEINENNYFKVKENSEKLTSIKYKKSWKNWCFVFMRIAIMLRCIGLVLTQVIRIAEILGLD
jgi:hypothetical protein